jgi:hypothetical protein
MKVNVLSPVDDRCREADPLPILDDSLALGDIPKRELVPKRHRVSELYQRLAPTH